VPKSPEPMPQVRIRDLLVRFLLVAAFLPTAALLPLSAAAQPGGRPAGQAR
jgi:hypothetical protein